MNWRFDEPVWWWALLLIFPVMATWWFIDRIPPWRRALALLLRAMAMACLIAALAQPWLLSTQSSLAVIGVIDASASVERLSETSARDLAGAFVRATERRRPDDRVGLVVFDAAARATAIPTSGPVAFDPPTVVDSSGTALAEAVMLARALVPAGEAGRIVVVSDGLETIDRAERIAAFDAERVAVDTLLLPLRPLADVAIESFDLPASAPPGSRAGAVLTLRSSEPADGTLRIRMDGRPLQLAGEGAAGDGLRIRLGAGSTRVRVSIPVGSGPVHELEAIVEPDDPDADRIAENSRAKRVLAVPAGRSVLVLDGGSGAGAIDRWLVDSEFEVRRMPADALPDDPLWLAGFDLIVLDDVPAALMPRAAQRMVADQVQHLGAGLIALGGPDSFGAGGWRGSTLADLLPVEVEPPTEDRRPRAALMFVIDRSGSMRQSVAGTNASQQTIANEAAALATESIASRAYVGVIAFENHPEVVVPPAPMDDPSLVAERIRGIRPDGGTAIGSALRAALDGLAPIQGVDRKLVVLLTDGRGRDDELLQAQAERAATEGVTVTTIAVGDSADDALLAQIAERTGGVFHPVRNPRVLPRVLVESVQSINRPLLREGNIGVVSNGDSEFARAVRDAPPLGGVCILGRPRSTESVIDAATDEGEPLVAHWPAGIGRVVAFASSADAPWCGAWNAWSGSGGFWQRLARWAARAPGSAPVAAEARIEDGRFVVVIEAAEADAVQGASVEGLIRAPDGSRRPFELRRVAPRRFVGSVDAEVPGAWLAVLSPRGESGPLPPLLAAAIAPEGIELARQEPDPAPLDSLRRASRGRELTLESLATTDLLSRDGLRLGVRERSLSPWLLAAAALLFVGDAAVRRLAVRRSQVSEVLRVTNASVESAEALAARRRASAANQRPGASSGRTVAPSSGASAARHAERRPAAADRAASPPAPTPSAASREPTEEEVRDALRILREGGSPSTTKSADAEAAPARDDSEDASSAAVEALRRAKDRSRIFPP